MFVQNVNFPSCWYPAGSCTERQHYAGKCSLSWEYIAFYVRTI